MPVAAARGGTCRLGSSYGSLPPGSQRPDRNVLVQQMCPRSSRRQSGRPGALLGGAVKLCNPHCALSYLNAPPLTRPKGRAGWRARSSTGAVGSCIARPEPGTSEASSMSISKRSVRPRQAAATCVCFDSMPSGVGGNIVAVRSPDGKEVCCPTAGRASAYVRRSVALKSKCWNTCRGRKSIAIANLPRVLMLLPENRRKRMRRL